MIDTVSSQTHDARWRIITEREKTLLLACEHRQHGGLKNVLLGGLMSVTVLSSLMGCAAPGDRASKQNDDTESSAIQRMQADRALQRGRFDDAIDAYTSFLAAMPPDDGDRVTMCFKLGQAYWKRDGRIAGQAAAVETRRADQSEAIVQLRSALAAMDAKDGSVNTQQIGRASCRERV